MATHKVVSDEDKYFVIPVSKEDDFNSWRKEPEQERDKRKPWAEEIDSPESATIHEQGYVVA